MPRPTQTEIRMRLVVGNPAPGVAYSLQDKAGAPVDAKTSKGAALSFDFPIRIAAGPKFYGDQVRSEGPERRFVYIAVGEQAGQKGSSWSRRMKIDIHTLSPALLDKARAGKVLQGMVAGTGKDGTPACATVQAKAWRAI